MKSCNHKVIFSEIIYSTNYGSSLVTTWAIKAFCPSCKSEIEGDEVIKTALQSMYSKELANTVYGTYKFKRGYFKLISELSANGINSGLFPVNND